MSKIRYCSLEEAWGEIPTPINTTESLKDERKEQLPNKDTNFECQLEPLTIKKEEPNPDFFTGLSMQERFQKLYDGSFERHFSKLHELRKKESYLQNSMGDLNASVNCQNQFNGTNLEGTSVSDKLQMQCL